VDQQLGLGWVLLEVAGLELVVGGLVGVEPVAVWPGPGGWGVGQGEGGPPLSLVPRSSRWLLWWSSSRGGRMLMERSQAVASLGQFSSGALGGCMPKPWPPVA